MPTQKPAIPPSRNRATKRYAIRFVPALERLEARLTPAPASITLETTIRDFQASHPDFQPGLVTDVVDNVVGPQLGDDRKPTFAGPDGRGAVTNGSTFNQWYNDVSGVNLTTLYQ